MPKFHFVGAALEVNDRKIDRFGTALEIDEKDLQHYGGVPLLPKADFAALAFDEKDMKQWPGEADRAWQYSDKPEHAENKRRLAAFVEKVKEARKKAAELEAARQNPNAEWVADAAKALKGGGK